MDQDGDWSYKESLEEAQRVGVHDVQSTEELLSQILMFTGDDYAFCGFYEVPTKVKDQLSFLEHFEKTRNELFGTK